MTTNKLIESRERLAKSVIEQVNGIAVKLKELEPLLKQLWREFDNLKDGETIMGCSNKTEFCDKKLHRGIRAVQYMLKGGNQNRKPARKTREKVSRANGHDTEPEESEPSEDSEEDVPEDFTDDAGQKARARKVLDTLLDLNRFSRMSPENIVAQLTHGEQQKLYSALLDLLPWLRRFPANKKPAASGRRDAAGLQRAKP